MTPALTDTQRDLVEEVLHYAQQTVYRRAIPPALRQEQEDIIGECYLALCRAAVAYDPERGRAWKTFAISYLRHVPTEYLRREDRLGRYQRDREDRRSAVRQLLRVQLGRQPRSDEIAAALGITEEQAEEWRTRSQLAGAWRDSVPLHEPVSHHELSFERTDTLEDHIPADTPTPEQVALQQDTVARVRRAIAGLRTERLRHIATAVYLDGQQQKPLAVLYGISESRIHQLMREIEAYLRRELADLGSDSA